MWLTKLKIALVEKNIAALDSLVADIPTLSKKEEIEEAFYLLKQAAELVGSLKDDTSYSMKQIKKNLQFLRSTDIPTSRNLDLMS